jgi:hypothetical protein
MAVIPELNDNQLQAICDILADTSGGLTGAVIATLLSRCEIPDPQPGITKRHRLFAALKAKQEYETGVQTMSLLSSKSQWTQSVM